MRTLFFVIVTVVLLCTSVAFATAPQLINYQGRLTAPSGTPLTGTYSIQFSIYSAPSGGITLWQETQSVTTDANGLFAVMLGSVNSISGSYVFSDSTRYLGIKIGSDQELAPRTRLVCSPYALRVSTIEGASGGRINGMVQANLPSGGEAMGAFSLQSYAGTNMGLDGEADGSSDMNVGVRGLAYDANGTSNSAAIYGLGLSHYGGSIWAGYFVGWTNVVGNFYASAKFFKIDDPKHPADRTLTHSCVESDEYKNFYDGVVTTDAEGNAVVSLPDWFDGLNRDFRYQLTCIGQFAQAIVSSEIGNNQFSIKSDKPLVKVSWQVTGVRKDAYANAHPFPVIKDKPAGLRGKYLHPLEQGVDEKLGVDYDMRQSAIEREKQVIERMKAANTSAVGQK